jgi:D-tyrosyl-tRNA(Tyr) deacylase
MARVTVDGADVGAIERGLLIYLGVGVGDDEARIAPLVNKIVGLRIFENEAGKMDRSVIDVGGSLLVVSQFTLYGDTQRGRRPSFDRAMPPARAEALYEAFLAAARAQLPVASGTFRAEMIVTSENMGPVTLWIDTEAV